MGAKKYRKSSLRENLKVQFFLILIISANGAPETDISVTDLNDNQIVFHEKGYVINRSTFVHVRFVMNMTEYMDGIQEVINGLNYTFYDEKKHVAHQFVHNLLLHFAITDVQHLYRPFYLMPEVY